MTYDDRIRDIERVIKWVLVVLLLGAAAWRYGPAVLEWVRA